MSTDLKLTISLTDNVSTPAKVVTDAMRRLGDMAGRVKNVFAPLNSTVVNLAGAFAGFSTVRKSIQEAEGAIAAADRLRVALGGSQRALEIVQRQAKQIAAQTVIDDDEIVQLADTLIQRGVPISKLQEVIAATVETSQALRQDLNSTGESIARTFNGVPARELRRQLAGLTEEQLRNGAATGRLLEIYKGQAAAFAQTATGKQQAAIRDIGNLLEDAGRRFIIVRDRLTRALVPALEQFVTVIESPSGTQFLSFLTTAAEFLARNAVYVVAFVAALKGLELVGPITTLFRGLYAVVALLFSPAGLFVGGVVVGTATVLELTRKITGLNVGVEAVVETVSDLFTKFRNGEISVSDLVDQFLTDLKVLGAYFRTYLYDVPTGILDNLITQAILKLEELVARARVTFAELTNIPGAERVLSQFGVSAPDLGQARSNLQRAKDASANAPGVLSGISGDLESLDNETARLRSDQTNRAIARGKAREDAAKIEAEGAKKARETVDNATLDQLNLGLDERFKVEEDAEKKARELRDLYAELEIRRLRARGEELQAARLELEVKQRKEFEEQSDRQRQGTGGQGEIDALRRTQSEELAAFEAQQLRKAREADEKRLADLFETEGKARGKYDELVRRSDALAQQGSISQREARERNSAAAEKYKQTLDGVTTALEREAEAASDPRVAEELREKIVALREEFELLKPQIETVGSVLRDSIQSPAENAFASLIKGSQSARQALAGFLQGFADNLAQFAAKKAVLGILDTVFGGGQSNPFASLFSIGLGEKRNAGGMIGGSGPDVDSVPALLTPGEFVVRRRSVGSSRRLLDGINSGAINDSILGGLAPVQRFAAGGVVPAASAVTARADAGPVILPVQVADEPSFRRMLTASGDALVDHFSRDPSKYRSALGI